MIERLRNAWLAFTAPLVSAEQDEDDHCPACGSSKLINVTTVDMPLDRKQFLCGNCNHSWQETQE